MQVSEPGSMLGTLFTRAAVVLLFTEPRSQSPTLHNQGVEASTGPHVQSPELHNLGMVASIRKPSTLGAEAQIP